MEYDSWDVSGRQVSVTKTISIDAGSQLTKIEAEYNWEGVQSLNLAVGLVKRSRGGVMLLDEPRGIMGYWEPPYRNSGTIGTACLLWQSTKIQVDKQILVIAKLDKPGKIIYYRELYGIGQD